MRKLLMLLFLCILTGCGNDDGTSSTNPYSGNWNIAFAGSYTGGGQMTIGSNGAFSVNVLLVDPDGTTSTNTVSGNVSSSGVLTNGRVFFEGQQIGTITGNFTGTSGSGSWQTSFGTSGSWSASRI